MDEGVGCEVVIQGEIFTFSLNKNFSVCTAELSATNQVLLIRNDRYITGSIISADSLVLCLIFAHCTAAIRWCSGFMTSYTCFMFWVRVIFAWMPGHCGIPGNESADQMAKLALDNATTHIPYVHTQNCIALRIQ